MEAIILVADTLRDWLNPRGPHRALQEVEGLFAYATDIGQKRSENQDRIAILHICSTARGQGFWCACLCDGMGGQIDGGKAANVAMSAFVEALIRERKTPPEERLEYAVNFANRNVRETVPGGGCTISALLLEAGRAVTLNIGDSRIYRIVDHQSRIERLTTDDTMEEAYGSEGRGLLQHLGMKGQLLPHIGEVVSLHGRVILTSDGAHNIGDNNLAALAYNSSSNLELCDRVTQLSRWFGGYDNASIVVLDLDYLNEDLLKRRETDVSIWSYQGRLKFTWPTNEGLESVLPSTAQVKERYAGKSHAENHKSDGSSADASTQAPTNSTDAPSNQRKQRKRKTAKKKTASEQIDLGLPNDDGKN